MEAYKIHYVFTTRVKPGKGAETVKWWREKGKATYELLPGVRSVRAYAVQFGLGGEYGIEIWMEMENYAALDLIDEDLETNREKYAAFGDADELFDYGPARLMGEWPQSHWSPERE